MEKQFLFVDVANPTWLVYLSVLVLAVYFRFSRLFTVRNLDLLLILVLSASLVITGEWKGKPADSAGLIEVVNGDRVAAVDGVSSVESESISTTEPVESDSVPTRQTLSSDTLHSDLIDAKISEQKTVEQIADSSRTVQPQDTGETIGLVGLDPTTEPRGNAADESFEQSVDSAPKLPLATSSPRQFHPVYRWGSVSLLGLSVLLMIRLVFDESLTRRPRLEQNLNQAGLAFLCVPAFALLTVSVFVVEPPNSAMAAVEHGKALLQRRETKPAYEIVEQQPPAPTETLIAAGAAGVAQLSGQWETSGREGLDSGTDLEKTVAQILVVIAHTIVVLGLLHIGRNHFSSLQLGLSMSCLYLLLPCTAFNVHQLSHVLPGACLTWAIASYRKPVVSGILLGLACGTLFFSVFLLPVWAVFYGRRGALRFGLSVFFVAAILAVCLMLTSSDADSFVSKLFTTMNWTVYRLLDETGSSPETPFGQLFVRIPLAALFFVMLTAMTVLPRPRNLENLLANSTALVVAAQLWYPEDIGTYVLWYLPLLLLVVFRPRLDRFTPPDMSGRATVANSSPTTNGAPSSVAMSRLTLYR